MAQPLSVHGDRPVRLVVGLLASVLIVAGCGERHEARAIVTLNVSRAGAYELQGRPVPESELKHELKAMQSSLGSVDLHIAADPMATYEAVGKAVKAAQDAGVRSVGFVTSEPQK